MMIVREWTMMKMMTNTAKVPSFDGRPREAAKASDPDFPGFGTCGERVAILYSLINENVSTAIVFSM
eukprot:scaffold22647_cov145-Cylindrotheca_fusiformis.AAC.7